MEDSWSQTEQPHTSFSEMETYHGHESVSPFEQQAPSQGSDKEHNQTHFLAGTSNKAQFQGDEVSS